MTKLNISIFREYDIRGIADKDLAGEFPMRLGRALGRLLLREAPDAKRLPVLVGQDCRLSGPRIADALTSGLLSSALSVTRLGICTSPITYFSAHTNPCCGAVMVTGSHNPKEYNGFKILKGQTTLHGAEIQKIKDLMAEEWEMPLPALLASTKERIEPLAPYLDYHVKNAKVGGRKLRVAIDSGSATAGPVAPKLFRMLGADVVELYSEMDGTFPFHHPDPTEPHNLRALIAAVKEKRADVGFAFDGDADRIGVVDENGGIIYGDILMILLSRALLKDNPGATVISEVKSSHRLYDAIARAGGKPMMWKTGHSLIKEKMKQSGALLAGEMSGHIFYSDRYFGFDDAIYAALRVYEILSHTEKSLGELLSDVPRLVSTPEIRIDCQEELKFELVKETRSALPRDLKVCDIDGVRAEFGDAWALVRASNTQPVLVLRFEGPTQARLDQVREIMRVALDFSAKKIGHPPLKF